MIKILCVGKLKEEYLKLMVADYLKRIGKYYKIDIIELKDSDIETECTELFNNINKKDFNVLLDREGNNYSSLNFANKISQIFLINSNITFIIGGSNGVNEKIKELVNEKISFGAITFPHGLFRGILLEQIYRAFKIINNETYHK